MEFMVWNLPYPDTVDIPGFQRITFVNRNRGNGGGVGFYIRTGLNFKIITPPFISFVDKIFESLTVEICYPVNDVIKKIIVTNVYTQCSMMPFWKNLINY
jgi:hypothetical protein